jgi:hypothetical protein
MPGRKFFFFLANIFRLEWRDLSCPLTRIQVLSLREAPLSAVAAATASLVLALAQLRYEAQVEGGSCCYRTPRPASPAHIQLRPTTRLVAAPPHCATLFFPQARWPVDVRSSKNRQAGFPGGMSSGMAHRAWGRAPSSTPIVARQLGGAAVCGGVGLEGAGGEWSGTD